MTGVHTVTVGPDEVVVLDDGEPVGRVGVQVEETCPPEFLGDLPPRETNLVGLRLPWSADWAGAGAALLAGVRDAGLPAPVQLRLNAESADHLAERRAVAESAGMELFQEKQGFTWAGSPVVEPDRLVFSTVTEVGTEAYRQVLGRVGAGTLDRNDAWYRRLAGEANWSGVFMTFLQDADAAGWLLATLPTGEPVGMVAVSAFDEPDTATIVFIGVVPEQRGHGYVDDLLAAGTAAARAAGYRTMLSDADVLNAPMAAAFARAGHAPDRRPWHVWHYRFPAQVISMGTS